MYEACQRGKPSIKQGARVFVNAPFRWSRLHQLANLVAIAFIGGCEVDQADPAISCNARSRVTEVLFDPSVATITTSKEMGEFKIQKGWCEPSQIVLRLHAESTFKHDHTYEVNCAGKAEFNLRYMLLADRPEIFSIEVYKKANPSPVEAKCATASPSRRK